MNDSQPHHLHQHDAQAHPAQVRKVQPNKRRFVILHHAAPPGEHWDLMIEADGSLATWQLEQDPCTTSDRTSSRATRIADHRMRYLDYQGPLTGRRGNVTRVDRGSCTVHIESPDDWTIEVTGRSLTGIIALHRTRDGWVLRRGPSP